MNVAVTGSSGHVGANLVRALLARGDTVRAVVRNSSAGIEGLGVERVIADVRDPGALVKAFDGVDAVYHLAAVISIDGDRGGMLQAVNVDGAANAAWAAKRVGVRRFLHMSSVHAFDMAGEEIHEESPAPGSSAPAYDLSKAAGGRAVRGAAGEMEVVTVHPSGVLGPHDYGPSRMGQVVRDLARGRMPFLVPGVFDWVDVRDVCEGCIAAMERGQPEPYILSGRRVPLPELAGLVAEAAGVGAPLGTVPMWVAKGVAPLATGWARVWGGEAKITRESLETLEFRGRFRHHKASECWGYAPRPITETVKDTVAWWRDQGGLGAS